MRIANLAGRLVLVTADRAVDVQRASRDLFSSDPRAIYARWAEFRAWAGRADLSGAVPFDPADLGAPSPSPGQVFAIGLNYSEHATEAGFTAPDGMPPVFTKFPTCITGPVSEVALPAGGHTDWEVELVVVVSRKAYQVREADAWHHIAGLTVGQDISERIVQMAGPAPQFSLGKSYPGFAPIGPCLVTPDEFADPEDLEISCAINGEVVQRDRTRNLIFSVPALMAGVSRVLPLLPGDVVFTGTPAGVGLGRTPPRWLAPGDELVSTIEGIGELRQHFVD